MDKQIDGKTLREISSHTRRLGLKRLLQSMGYERCAELPLCIELLRSRFRERFKYLDIGTGESVLPTFFLNSTKWDITCLDKFNWVSKQYAYAKRVYKQNDLYSRIHVINENLLSTELEAESYDIITNISVIEHFPGTLDTIAMQRSAQLLRPGGIYLLTTLVNDGFSREFYLNKSVYGDRSTSGRVFYQRHYDIEGLQNRLVVPSGLIEQKRLFFGEYRFRFSRAFITMPWPWKPVKVFYQWATPTFARRFLSYREYPVSETDMKMNTSSGVVIVLTKN